MTKRQANKIDREIELAFYRRCSGIPINIMDMGKVYAAGRLAATTGADVEAAVVDAVARLAVAS